MDRKFLEQQIENKKSVLCVGLDSDPDRIPAHLKQLEDPIFEFNKAIIDATHQYAIAYKPNLAFYEAEGLKGWQSLEKTMHYLSENYPEIFTIADAKRGDIGNTGKRYAKAFFETINFDSVTVAPYMGSDSVKPFLGYPGKWVILLALTSNPGGTDFQLKLLDDGKPLYQEVLRQSSQWGSPSEMMFVVGATKADFLKEIRKIVPDHFLLVPGVGAQGGTVAEVMEFGKAEKGVGLLINSSRGIIFASSGKDFAEAAAQEALTLQRQMAKYL
jgi:orotidine-5'-phosphate decarboxylase